MATILSLKYKYLWNITISSLGFLTKYSIWPDLKNGQKLKIITRKTNFSLLIYIKKENYLLGGQECRSHNTERV